MFDDLELRRRRAAFRANHRGTKEMDWLLGRFAQAKLPEMAGVDLDLFEQLIQLPDPDLQNWILDPGILDQPMFQPLIDELRRFHNLSQPAL
jgi:antitoxin CptB